MSQLGTTVHFDLRALAASDGTGPLFGQETEDIDLTFLRWKDGHRIQRHVNDEVDVVMIVVEGKGEAIVDGQLYKLEKGEALVIPKGVEREVVSGSDGFSYLNIHKRRKRLMPTLEGRPRRTEAEKHDR